MKSPNSGAGILLNSIALVLWVLWCGNAQASSDSHSIWALPLAPGDFDPFDQSPVGALFQVGYSRRTASVTEIADGSRLNVDHKVSRTPVAALTKLNDVVNFYSFFSSKNDSASADASNGLSMEREFSEIEVGAGPALQFGRFAFGGAVSYLSLGSESLNLF